MRRTAILCALVALLAAAGPAVVSARPAAGGWATHRAAGAHVSLAVPSTWVDVTRLTPQVLARVKELPTLAAYVRAAQQSKAIKLMLVDVGPQTVASGFAMNCNVVQAPTFGDLRLVRDASVAQVRATGVVVGQLHAGYVRLPAGRAVELRYEAHYGGTMPTVSLLQFIFVRAGVATSITYSTLPRYAAKDRPIFLRSARSVRLA